MNPACPMEYAPCAIFASGWRYYSMNDRILVVDDEADICEILRFNLEAEQFEVDTAFNAEQALSLLMSHRAYALLLLDVMLDGMSGFDLVKRLREDGITTPVIFLTAMDGHDAQLQGLNLGADDYITKPFSFDTVLARIRAVLRRCRTVELPAPLTAHGLTKREAQILQLLQAHPGRYFSRLEILSAVWPDDTLVGERSVDVHIARIRRKLGGEGGRIVNKTGYGYGLV